MNTIFRICTIFVLTALTALPSFALDDHQVRQWREDIQFYRTALEDGHIDLYHSVSKERFASELDHLVARLSELNEHQIVTEMMRITRLINDGHTQFPIMAGPHKHYPLRFFMIDGDVYVLSASESLQKYLGARIVAIDGVAITDVLKTIAPVVQPAENEYGQMQSLAFHLTVDNMLFGTGVTQAYGSAKFTFETPDGAVSNVDINSLSMSEYLAETTHWIDQQKPFQDPELTLNKHLWITTNPETQTAYLYFSQYPALEEIMAFGPILSEYLAAKGTRNIIIDLRDNGGGDFYVGLALSSPILMADSIDWQNGVYVLIGRTTFSAAMSNAVQFRQILNARLVGEPTGANPISYSEVGRFRLPNSGRRVLFSKRLYRFQAAPTAGVQPDIFVQRDVDQFRNGEDPVVEWVMHDIRSRIDATSPTHDKPD